MGRFKEFSKCCKDCGVEWNEGWTNKTEGRALCLDCMSIERAKRKENLKMERVANDADTKLAKMQPFKFEHRQEHWTKVNKEIRKLKKVEDIRAFITKQADEIFANEALMEYINYQSLK